MGRNQVLLARLRELPASWQGGASPDFKNRMTLQLACRNRVSSGIYRGASLSPFNLKVEIDHTLGLTASPAGKCYYLLGMVSKETYEAIHQEAALPEKMRMPGYVLDLKTLPDDCDRHFSINTTDLTPLGYFILDSNGALLERHWYEVTAGAATQIKERFEKELQRLPHPAVEASSEDESETTSNDVSNTFFGTTTNSKMLSRLKDLEALCSLLQKENDSHITNTDAHLKMIDERTKIIDSLRVENAALKANQSRAPTGVVHTNADLEGENTYLQILLMEARAELELFKEARANRRIIQQNTPKNAQRRVVWKYFAVSLFIVSLLSLIALVALASLATASVISLPELGLGLGIFALISLGGAGFSCYLSSSDFRFKSARPFEHTPDEPSRQVSESLVVDEQHSTEVTMSEDDSLETERQSEASEMDDEMPESDLFLENSLGRQI